MKFWHLFNNRCMSYYYYYYYYLLVFIVVGYSSNFKIPPAVAVAFQLTGTTAPAVGLLSSLNTQSYRHSSFSYSLHNKLFASFSNNIDSFSRKCKIMASIRSSSVVEQATDHHSQERRPLVIGLVGGIASGKSTVSSVLKDSGADVIDADKLGHEAYQKGTSCYNRLIAEFGDQIIANDGIIDRKVLGGIVFGCKENMERLQNVVWPEIRSLAQQRIEEYIATRATSCIVFEAAVMLEAGWQDMVDELWVVEVDRRVAMERLMKRNNLSAEEATKRLNSQMDNAARRKYADVVIVNADSLEDLEAQVKELWEKKGSFGGKKKMQLWKEKEAAETSTTEGQADR